MSLRYDVVGSAAPHPSGDVVKLPFSTLWSSLEVTFLYENFLLELRHIAFEGKSHMCEFAFSGLLTDSSLHL